MYKKILRSLICKGIAGFVGGFLFAYIRSPQLGIWRSAVIGLFCATIPYGWQLSGRLLGTTISISIDLSAIVIFIIRLAIAILTGWIAYPIVLVYYFIKAKGKDAVQSTL